MWSGCERSIREVPGLEVPSDTSPDLGEPQGLEQQERKDEHAKQGLIQRLHRQSSPCAVDATQRRDREGGLVVPRIVGADGSSSRTRSSGVRPASTNAIIWSRNSAAWAGGGALRYFGIESPPPPTGEVSPTPGQLQADGGSARRSE